MPEAIGIENTLAFLKGLEDVAVDAKKMLADGKVTLEDLPIAMTLIGQLGEITAAVKAVPLLPAEAKDYSADDVQKIGVAVLEMIAKVRAA